MKLPTMVVGVWLLGFLAGLRSSAGPAPAQNSVLGACMAAAEKQNDDLGACEQKLDRSEAASEQCYGRLTALMERGYREGVGK